MKSKVFLLLIIWLIELFSFSQWTICRNFTDLFHLSVNSEILQLQGEIHSDKGAGVIITHIFHNKPIFFSAAFLQDYLQYFDVRFLLQFISLIGVIGMIWGIWFFLQKHKKRWYVLLLPALLLLLPIIEILINPNVPFLLRLIILVLPYQAFSLYGWFQFLQYQKGKRTMIIIAILLIISIWYFGIFYHAIGDYCVKI